MKAAGLLLALLLVPTLTSAQGAAAPLAVEPLPWLVVDARAGWPSIGDDELTAAALGVAAVDMPQRALAGVVAVNGYPLRRGSFKVGAGAEMLLGRGRYQKKNADGEAVGDPITRTVESVNWQVSLNFGRGQGWSYLTVGSGLFSFDSFAGEGPGDAPGRTTLNAGVGARWFKWRHVGLNVDMRFYLTKASDGGLISAPRGVRRLVVLSAGLTFK
jgi:hypothetical protein